MDVVYAGIAIALILFIKPLVWRIVGYLVALAAATRAQVDACHRIALAQGGRDEGAPGLRPRYHPDYYGAYFRDPDGNKLCVVCHAAEG